jgi:2-polyprenyl-3-methyl-5-hydroxy-6-metoxy-1,4-benzoquinol methylase
MSIPENYIDINRDAWNKRTAVHVNSEFYNLNGFLAGASSLSATETALLGDVRGKTILHLQCHFGLDTLSMARMGATVTGADFSDKAIGKARELSQQLQLDATFICCNIYDLPSFDKQQYDIVFTSFGTIGWLPDLDKWAAVVRHFMKPGGKFIMADFHPVVWMFDNEFSFIQYSYFKKEAIVENSVGTYTDRSAPIAYQEIGWNHSLDELLSALLQQGMGIAAFKEYDFTHHNCFSGMKEVGPGRFQLEKLAGKIPMMYSIEAFCMPASKF